MRRSSFSVLKLALWISKLGIGKEIYDAKNGSAEKGDLIADIIGSTFGSIVVTIPF